MKHEYPTDRRIPARQRVSLAEPTRLTEADLLRTYQRPYQVARPCACGMTVLADPAEPADGVREHQATERHRDWRERWLAE